MKMNCQEDATTNHGSEHKQQQEGQDGTTHRTVDHKDSAENGQADRATDDADSGDNERPAESDQRDAEHNSTSRRTTRGAMRRRARPTSTCGR